MINIKKVLVTALLAVVVFYSCGDDNGQSVVSVDHEAQALKDKDTISKFLANHYFDETVDSIKTLVSGKTPLSEDIRLKSVTINEYDIDYTYYYFVQRQGNPEQSKIDPTRTKDFPTVVDSILPTYRLRSFKNSSTVVRKQELTKATWFDPAKVVVRGWLYGFTHFKGGKFKKNFNGPITYENGGKGFFILPSGLCYRNTDYENFIYYINLYDIVENTDGDLDGIPSILEDLDGNGKPWDDDTDKDNIPNYLDTDDDGDGILTRFEDANNDGDPRNDFSDPDNPTTPDYLNFKWRKSNQ